jgi:hypothetical protein
MIQVQGLVVHIRRAGKQLRHRIQKRLNRLVLVGGAHENRRDLPLQGAFSHRVDQHFCRDGCLFKHRFGQFI